MSEYTEQAESFLQKYNIKCEITWLKYDKYFDADTNNRDIYTVTFSREKRKGFSVTFGSSIKDSELRHMTERTWQHDGWKKAEKRYQNPNDSWRGYHQQMKIWKALKPTSYDVLACITKSDPGKFSDFCGDFGYDEDSRNAYKTYEAVRDEWLDVQSFFTSEELEELQEIN